MKIKRSHSIKKISFVAVVFSFFLLFSFVNLSGNNNQPEPKPTGNEQESHAAKHEEHADAGEESIPDVIIHHVMDNHDWHFWEFPAGTDAHGKQQYTNIAIHLPWILYNSAEGLQFFGNTEKLSENEHYIVAHEKVHYVKSKTPLTGISEEELKANAAKYVVIAHGKHKMIFEADPTISVMDFSVTKTSLQIMIVCFLMGIIFISIAKSYTRREGKAPKGIQSFFEPLIVFVRDEIAHTYLPRKADKYVPFFLTMFFFIWFSNLFGLTPLNSNITGNTSVTITLAAITFFVILISSTKDFWMHILWFPGVPIFIKPLMFVVELVGVITKPAALAIRLFANISAGHFMILALVCLIFILQTPFISPLTFAFGLFILSLEMLVALVQAYVFTLLAAVFIGQAMETHSHSHDEAHSHH
jgi:F-type H+-transporting ATPase subunit a